MLQVFSHILFQYNIAESVNMSLFSYVFLVVFSGSTCCLYSPVTF